MKFLDSKRSFIQDLQLTLREFPCNLFLEKKIWIDKSNHPFWKTYQSHPPLKYTSRRVAQIHHYFNSKPGTSKKRFILDSEHILHFSGVSRDYQYMISHAKEIAEKLSSEQCAAIIFPTQGAVREARKYINSTEVFKKIHVVKPAYELAPPKIINDKLPFNILSIGNKFWGKGMHLSLKIFQILKQKFKYDIQFTIVCGDIPNGYVIPKGVTVIDSPNISDQLRTDLYSNADIFLFPCLHDSFGVYQEALAYGLPVLSTKIYDKDEIVIQGKSGYLIDTPLSMYDGNFGIDWKNWDEFQAKIRTMSDSGDFNKMIDEFVSKIEELIIDRSLVKEMSIFSQQLHQSQFTIPRKNMEILKIYDQIYSE